VLGDHSQSPVTKPERDTVSALEDQPTIVSISDIHGNLSDAQSALLTLSDHPEYDSIVELKPPMKLEWTGGDDYVLVFNGDLIDRGPHNKRVVKMVERLIDQAPPGHIRITLGNHEMGILMPDRFGWSDWYSAEQSDDERRAFTQSIIDGHVVAAYEGHTVTYAHAGQCEPYAVETVNDTLVEAMTEFYDAIGGPEDVDMQDQLVENYPRVLGLDSRTGRGPEAGIAWLDFEYMEEDAPRQVVGHTRQDNPIRRGNVVCQNVIRNNRLRDGGEAITVETPDKLVALGRDSDDFVIEHEFDLPAQREKQQA